MLGEIIKAANLHPSRIFNITVFGSRVYGTCNANSDWDIAIVANNSVESIELKTDKYNIHIFTPDKFYQDLLWHNPRNLECHFAPGTSKILSTKQFDFILDKKKLKHSVIHTSNSSWEKAGWKFQNGDRHSAIKSAFHSLRIPQFGLQILKHGTILDFSCANSIYWQMLSINNWEQLEELFSKNRTDILNNFINLAKV